MAECADEWTFRYGAGATMYPKLVTPLMALTGKKTRVKQAYARCLAEVGEVLSFHFNYIAWAYFVGEVGRTRGTVA